MAKNEENHCSSAQACTVEALTSLSSKNAAPLILSGGRLITGTGQVIDRGILIIED
jgi:hypothetical protein